MINGYEVYYIYIGIKNHFYSKKYDYWKYNKRLSSNIDIHSMEKRSDKGFFHVVGKKFNNKRDLENFFIANFKHDFKYITDMVKNEECYRIFGNHMKAIDALKYHLEEDVDKINGKEKEHGDVNYITSGRLVRDVFRHDILFETLCFFNIFFSLFNYYDKHFDDTMYKEKRLFLTKYCIYLTNTVAKDVLDIIKQLYYKNFIRRLT